MVAIYKPIKPKHLKYAGLQKKLIKFARTYADGVDRDFRKTYETWSKESQPTQRTSISVTKTNVSIQNEVVGKIYGFVDKGTQGPYEIKPIRAKRLRFNSGYNAKTVVNQIRSSGGGPTGEIVYSLGVTHPGIEARNFSKNIMRKWSNPFFKAMQRALNEWAKESGHSL